MSNAQRVVSIALAEVGYHEKASNNNLDNPTANSGSGNWTKYARDLAAAGYYNGNKNGYAWCDSFVDWCFFKAYGSKAAAEKVQCQSGDLGAACPNSADYFKAKGRFDKTPKYGDQVFFGDFEHTGLCVGVTATTISTVEGNSGDAVKQHTYSRNDSYIAGYGHPLYDDDGGSSSGGGKEPAPTPESVKDLTEYVKDWQRWLAVDPDGDPGTKTEDANFQRIFVALVKAHPAKIGDKGDYVRCIQGLLYAAGYDPNGFDGEFGAGMETAVKAFQKDHGLGADGEVGADTLAALIEEVFKK